MIVGNLHNPVHKAGNAIERIFIRFASLNEFPIVRFSISGHSKPLLV